MFMTNLFFVFDPSLSLFSFYWLVVLFILLFLPSFYWVSSYIFYFFLSLVNFVKGEINYVLFFPSKGLYALIGSIFFSLVLFNFLALFPFVFSCTSHLSLTFPISYIFWLSIIFFSLSSYLKGFLSHLVPVGTPLGLMSFMVLVEFLSNLIRPLALTFRLTANMMAGHLLMSLIGGALVNLPFSFMVLGSSLQFFLLIMEMGVSVIQAYVFSTLLLLYISEGKY